MRKIMQFVMIITFAITPIQLFEVSAEAKENNVDLRSTTCTGYATQSSKLGSGITIKVYGTWTYRTDGTWNYRESVSATGAPAGVTYNGSVLNRFGSSFSYLVEEWYKGSMNLYEVNVYMNCD